MENKTEYFIDTIKFGIISNKNNSKEYVKDHVKINYLSQDSTQTKFSYLKELK